MEVDIQSAQTEEEELDWDEREVEDEEIDYVFPSVELRRHSSKEEISSEELKANAELCEACRFWELKLKKSA